MSSGPPNARPHYSGMAKHWPPARLRIVGPRVELRIPNDDELVQLLDLIDRGVHSPELMPFSMPWTDAPKPQRVHDSLAWYWSARASLAGDGRWTLQLAVFVDGEPVGVQDVFATNFASLRTVKTGSWLGIDHHGDGIGTEMREAALALAFDGLDARCAVTEAYEDNVASIRVSEKCGYMRNGSMPFERTRGPQAPGGESTEVVEMIALRIDQDDWRSRTDRPAFEVHGLDAELLAMLGAH